VGLKGRSPAAISSKSIAGLSVPSIAAINGDALGGGLELALACDLRVAAEGARLGFPDTSNGLIPSGGGTQRLPRLVGRGKALEMLLTAQPVDAAEASRIGLVNMVVARSQVMATAEKLAQRILSRGPMAVRYAKEAVQKGLEMTLEQGLRLEADLSFILQTTRDRDEGIKAFLEKRPPKFKGE
jgi:enoyl-CoA hydratase